MHTDRGPAIRAATTLAVVALLGGCTSPGREAASEPTSPSTAAPGAGQAAASAEAPAPTPSASALPPGTREERGEWELVAITPDERHLVTSLVSPGCGVTLHRLEVVETGTEVTIEAIAAVPTGPAKCPGLGNLVLAEATLADPLGDRQLTGCRTDDPVADCREPNLDGVDAAAAGAFPIQTFGDVSVLARSGLRGYAVASGEELWHRGDLTEVSAPAGRWGDLLVVRRSDGAVVALDAATGETAWEVFDETYGPHTTSVGRDVVVVPHRETFTTLHALDPATGDLVWRYEAADATAVTGIVMTPAGEMLVHARGPDHAAGYVAVVDQRSGAETDRWDVPAGAMIDVHDGQVVFDVGDDRLQVYSLAGDVVLETTHPPGLVRTVADGAALVSSEQGWSAIDLTTGDLRWQTDHDHHLWTVSDALGLVLQQAPDVLVIDPATGEPRVRLDTLDVPLDASAEASQTVATANAALGMTAAGTVAWWQHAPPDTTRP